MRALPLTALVAALVLPAEGSTQSSARAEQGLYFTMFRSPATGLELRSGHAATHLGFYPTVIERDGVTANANFIRAGVTYYMNARGASLFVTPSIVWSLDSDWRNGALTEVGFRGRVYGRLNGRVGAAVLTTRDGPTRLNPTIGFDIKLGGTR